MRSWEWKRKREWEWTGKRMRILYCDEWGLHELMNEWMTFRRQWFCVGASCFLLRLFPAIYRYIYTSILLLGQSNGWIPSRSERTWMIWWKASCANEWSSDWLTMNLLMQQNHQKKPPLRLITERHAPSPQGRFMRKQNVLDCPEVDDEASDPKLLHCYCYWLPYLLLVTFPSPFTQKAYSTTSVRSPRSTRHSSSCPFPVSQEMKYGSSLSRCLYAMMTYILSPSRSCLFPFPSPFHGSKNTSYCIAMRHPRSPFCCNSLPRLLSSKPELVLFYGSTLTTLPICVLPQVIDWMCCFCENIELSWLVECMNNEWPSMYERDTFYCAINEKTLDWADDS
jgi:hypothetical protein